MAQRHFLAQARNNAWANHRLLTACSALTQEDFAAPRGGFFGSLRATLNHILIVDWYYVDALEGGSLGPAAWRDEEPCKTVADLQREQAAVDRRLIEVCAALDEAALEAPMRLIRAAGDKVERTERVLLHLFQHQVHHRGQAHGLLSTTSVAPPQLDEFFLQQDAELRKEELAVLGWAEEALWPD
ncbi:DinB family protein [Pelagibius sp.]|uniref:DinB family protein n=1 Tax=Pelagibius sp. TaxID=1931238 RepID=UPI0026254EC7|nr:DinB family protein [Pelagibius sp.]